MNFERVYLVGLSIILFISIFIGSFAMIGGYVYLGNLDKKDLQLEAKIVSSRNLTEAEIENYKAKTQAVLSNFDLRLLSIEDKLNNISIQQAALQSQIAAMNETERINATAFNGSLQRIEMQLAFQYTMFLKLNNSLANNLSIAPSDIPNELLRYQNLSCYERLKQAFCVNDWCRNTLNPEWICAASQQLQEYAQWNNEACGCAREAGLNV